MSDNKKLFIITGDYSGDKHASDVVKTLYEKFPNLVIEGVGGINLEKAGVKTRFSPVVKYVKLLPSKSIIAIFFFLFLFVLLYLLVLIF